MPTSSTEPAASSGSPVAANTCLKDALPESIYHRVCFRQGAPVLDSLVSGHPLRVELGLVPAIEQLVGVQLREIQAPQDIQHLIDHIETLNRRLGSAFQFAGSS